MCGIAGILCVQPCISSGIERLTSALMHRGPDGYRHWRSDDQRVQLGHTRLSILDLSVAADQPMTSLCGRFTIAFNGEIYNFLELRTELQNEGYKFRTSSDTEVLLNAFIAWGENALDKFNGMWAFAIYDARKKTAFIARDRYGVKPLYYFKDKTQFLFASEIQAIDRYFGGRLSNNEHFLRSLAHYDLSAYSLAETSLDGVLALPAGFSAWIDQDLRFEPRQWYTLSRVPVPSSLKSQGHELRDLLSDACRIRLRSDVPVATCLSGGIDSGSIVSLLSEIGRDGGLGGTQFSHRSFNAAFPGTELDETEAAKGLAQAKGMDLDVKIIECPTPDELERAMEACDGPMPTLAFYPIWKLYEHIKHAGISVTLDGQGADEMLGGYYLGFPSLMGAWQKRRPLWCADIYRTYRSLGPEARREMQVDFGRLMQHAKAEVDQAIKRPIKQILKACGLYDNKLEAKSRDLPLSKYVSRDDSDCGNSLAQGLWHQFFTNPLPFLLHQYDRCSMSSGVECRMPFMDYRVVEYLFSLPLQSRVGGGYTKRVLREGLKGVLPEPVRTNRIKTGFNAPFSRWLKGPLRQWTEDTMASQSFYQSSYFDGAALRRSFQIKCESGSQQVDEWSLWPCLHISWWESRHQTTRTASPQRVSAT